MLNFSFSDEQDQFRASLKKFASKEIAPRYSEWDTKCEFPFEPYEKTAKFGLTGLIVPEEYGGAGSDYVTLGIALEELGRADFSLALSIMCLSLVTGIITKSESNFLKAEWLPKISKGETRAGAAITEPDCGSDAAAMKMKAVRNGDSYTLTGEKWSISFSMSDIFLIFAKTDFSQKSKGVTAFLVPSDLEGFSTTVSEDMGCKGILRGALHLDQVKVPVQNRIGEESDGFKIIMKEFDFSKVGIGLIALGAAQASMDDAINYAKKREAFGRPLAKFEGISFHIAESATLIEAAKLLCYRTLWMRDQRIPHIKDAAMCKWWALKTSVSIIHQALLIVGSPAYSKDYAIEQRLRDAIGWQIGDGTAEIQKIIISRELLGREFLPY